MPRVSAALTGQAHSGRATRFTLLGVGEELVRSHSEARLLAGRFTLPDETPWYDRGPWKFLLPPIVSAIVSTAR